MRNTIVLFTLVCVVLLSATELNAQHLGEIEEVGSIYNFWGSLLDISIQGDYAYIAANDAGLNIVDISYPENPELVSYLDVTDRENPELIPQIEGDGSKEIYIVDD